MAQLVCFWNVLPDQTNTPRRADKESRQVWRVSPGGPTIHENLWKHYPHWRSTHSLPIVSILRCPTTWTNLAVTPKLLADLLKSTINQAKPPNTSQHLAILEPKYLESFCRQAQHGYTADSRHHGTGELTGTNTGRSLGRWPQVLHRFAHFPGGALSRQQATLWLQSQQRTCLACRIL